MADNVCADNKDDAEIKVARTESDPNRMAQVTNTCATLVSDFIKKIRDEQDIAQRSGRSDMFTTLEVSNLNIPDGIWRQVAGLPPDEIINFLRIQTKVTYKVTVSHAQSSACSGYFPSITGYSPDYKVQAFCVVTPKDVFYRQASYPYPKNP